MQLEKLKDRLKSRKFKNILVGVLIICGILAAYTMDAKRIHRESESENIVEFEGGIIKKGYMNDIIFDEDYEIKASDIIGIKQKLSIERKELVNIYQKGQKKGIYMNFEEGFHVGEVNEQGNIMVSERAMIEGDKIIYPYELPDEPIDNTNQQVTEVYEDEGDITDEVKYLANSIISAELRDKITNTTLDSLQVNENLGTDSDEDVIVLANLSWSTKNTEKTTREMLEMYSDHIAATLASDLEDGSEIALFWDAEYTGLSIKHSYYIKNGNAYKQ